MLFFWLWDLKFYEYSRLEIFIQSPNILRFGLLILSEKYTE